MDTEQEKFWKEEFGNEYIKRNNSRDLLNSKTALWANILKSANKVESAFELGCNIGLNLIALKNLKPSLQLSGVEINESAAMQAQELEIGEIYNQSFLDPLKNSIKYDLTFTFGVLIHVNPDYLDIAYQRLYESSKKYIVICEYFNPSPVEVCYRGHKNKLFKRDFAGELIEKYSLKLVNYGFIYARDNWTPMDNFNWFLLEK